MAYDRDRYDRDRYDRDRHDRDRYDRDRAGRDDRGIFERAGDEVRSWFGEDEAQRRRERDERERWSGERDRDRSANESYRNETFRDYSDRYGRSYSSPMDRDRWAPSSTRPFGGATSSREFDRPPAYRTYARGSQEFGPEGYGAPRGWTRSYGGEWRSPETWRVPGPYTGRGPRSYRRPDERIREELNERLTAHGLIDATDVECQIQNGEVTLTGFVDSREAKRAAEDVAEDIAGVREVHNHLRIRSHAEDVGVGRTNVLGLTERETQTAATAPQGDVPGRSRAR